MLLEKLTKQCGKARIYREIYIAIAKRGSHTTRRIISCHQLSSLLAKHLLGLRRSLKQTFVGLLKEPTFMRMRLRFASQSRGEEGANALQSQLRPRIGLTMPLPKACKDFSFEDTIGTTHSVELSGECVNHLALQDQPNSPQNRVSCYQISLRYTCDSFLAIPNIMRDPCRGRSFHMGLFDLDMPADGTLIARVCCKRTTDSKILEKAGLWFVYINSSKETCDKAIEIPPDASAKSYDIPISVPHRESLGSENARLKEFGVFCSGPATTTSSFQLPMLEIFNMTIAPQFEHFKGRSIVDIHVSERKSGQHKDRRLAWNWCYPRHLWPADMPWSQTTGCFERFYVEIGGKLIGEVCCTELPLREQDFRGLEGEDEVGVTVKGIYFGGGCAEQSDIVAQPYFV